MYIRALSPTSAQSSASTSRCRSTRRPGDPRRRPLQVRLRRGPAVRRRRAPVSPWLFPPADRRGWPPGARASRTSTRRTCRSATRRARDGSPLRVPVELPGRDSSTPPSGSPRSAGCRCSCSTRTSRQRRRRPPDHRTSCTCAGARCGSTRSSSWGSAASAPCGRSASSRRSGISTRATPPSCCVERARELVAEPGLPFDEALDQVGRDARLHHPHARPGGQRALRRRLVRRILARCSSTPAATPSGSWSWAAASTDDPAPVRHDRLRPAPHGATPTPSASSTRETANATWQGVVGHPILGITNGVHVASWLAAAAAPALRAGLGADSLASTRPGPAASGSGSTASRRRDLWDAHLQQKLELRALRPAAGCAPVRAPRRVTRRAAPTATRSRPRRPHHRLRPPLRHLQARRAALPRRGAAGPPVCDPERPVQIVLRRQGPPGRPTRASRSSSTSSA